MTWKMSLLFVAIGMAATACQRTYSGIYLLGSIQSEVRIEISTLETQLDLAVKDFGFERRTRDPTTEVRVWSKHRSRTAAELLELKGSEAHIVLSLRVDTLSIGIRDLDNDVETEFVRALEDRIESSLKDVYGVREIPFKRVSDIFS